jgi:hypothetical protein
MFEPVGLPPLPLEELEPLCEAPLGTPWPVELDEPEVVPGTLEPVLEAAEPAGPIAEPGIAGPGSPGYITVAPMPVMISGRCSRAPFRYPIPHAHSEQRARGTHGSLRNMIHTFRCKISASSRARVHFAELRGRMRATCRRAAQRV